MFNKNCLTLRARSLVPDRLGALEALGRLLAWPYRPGAALVQLGGEESFQRQAALAQSTEQRHFLLLTPHQRRNPEISFHPQNLKHFPTLTFRSLSRYCRHLKALQLSQSFISLVHCLQTSPSSSIGPQSDRAYLPRSSSSFQPCQSPELQAHSFRRPLQIPELHATPNIYSHVGDEQRTH